MQMQTLEEALKFAQKVEKKRIRTFLNFFAPLRLSAFAVGAFGRRGETQE